MKALKVSKNDPNTSKYKVVGYLAVRASTRLCTYDLPRLCTCDSPRLCTYDFLVDAIRMPASCAMGHSNVLVLDMHVLFGTKMFALLLGPMVFCIVNAKTCGTAASRRV